MTALKKSYNLVRDILDNQLLDADGRAMGKVDGVVLELHERTPPRVVALETGGVTAAQRLHRPWRNLFIALAHRWGAQKGEPYRIPWALVNEVDVDIVVNVDARGTPVLYWERLLSERIVRHIPGS